MATNKPFDKKLAAAAKDVCSIGIIAPIVLQVELLEAIEARLDLLKPDNVVYNNPIYTKSQAIRVLEDFYNQIQVKRQ